MQHQQVLTPLLASGGTMHCHLEHMHATLERTLLDGAGVTDDGLCPDDRLSAQIQDAGMLASRVGRSRPGGCGRGRLACAQE